MSHKMMSKFPFSKASSAVWAFLATLTPEAFGAMASFKNSQKKGSSSTTKTFGKKGSNMSWFHESAPIRATRLALQVGAHELH